MMNTYKWKAKQHQLYLKGLERYGNNWAAIADLVGTRSGVQVRSHHVRRKTQRYDELEWQNNGLIETGRNNGNTSRDNEQVYR